MRDIPGVRRPVRIRVFGVFAAVTLAAGSGVFGAGFAAADATPFTLKYMCPFPLIGDQLMTATGIWPGSDTHVVGQATPVYPVSASGTVGPAVTQGMSLVGATSFEGTVDVTGTVVAPQGLITETVALDVPVTAIPSSGSLTVTASGHVPSVVFTKPGRAYMAIGQITLHLTPVNADGGTTALGEVNSACTIETGQNDVLTTFQILAAATSPTSATTSGRASTQPSSTDGSPGSASPSGSDSASPKRTTTAGPSASAPSATRTASAASGSASATGDTTGAAAPIITPTSSASNLVTPLLLAFVGLAALIAVGLGAIWRRKRHHAADPGSGDGGESGS